MGAHILFTVAAALLLLATATTTATPECDIFHVTGSVLCQECGEGWNEWVNGANPIQGTLKMECFLNGKQNHLYFFHFLR